MKLIIISVFLLLGAVPARGWWCLGHMLVGHIAYKSMSPTTAREVSRVIASLSDCGNFPLTPDVMQVGCWADDLKAMGLYTMTGWHFIDLPYNPEGVPVPELSPDNVLTVTDGLMKAMRRPSQQNPWVLSFALANLIHFYGDIHQPLHAITLYSSEFPRGDRGGNEIKVTAEGQKTNLHAVWDSICYQYTDPGRPLNPDNRLEVDAIANKLLSTYQFPSSEAKVWNTTRMALESYNAAIKYAYPGSPPGATLSQDYMRRCVPVAEGRIVLAGLRLANELDYLFSNYESHEIPQAIHTRLARHQARMWRVRKTHF